MMMHALKMITLVNEVVDNHMPHLPLSNIYIGQLQLFESVYSV